MGALIDIGFSRTSINIRPKGFFINLKRRLTDLSPLFDGPIDASVVQFFTRQFASSGKIGGYPWAPLRPATIALKRRRGRENMGILRDSNRLWASLTKRTGPQVVKNVTSDRYERGTSDPKALPHQTGFTQDTIFGRQRRFPRTVKPRIIVPDPLPRHLVTAWEKLTVKHILGA